jgi:glycine betaine/proline transport system ATP-binding protein
MSTVVRFNEVCIMFGPAPKRALEMADAGGTREDIQSATTHVLGVHDCTLEVEEGEILVLMGLSGSGKSTLLRAVNGLNPVARGSVEVEAGGGRMVDVTHADAKTLRELRQSRVAMVFQAFGLLPWRTVRENVGFGLELSGMSVADRNAQVDRQLSPRRPQRLGRAQGGRVVGRHAAARGPRPRLCDGRADPVDG